MLGDAVATFTNTQITNPSSFGVYTTGENSVTFDNLDVTDNTGSGLNNYGFLPEDVVRLCGGLLEGADKLQVGLAFEHLLLRTDYLSERFYKKRRFSALFLHYYRRANSNSNT